MEKLEVGEEVETSSVALPKIYKIVFLGNACVGKTSLINNYMYDTFDETYTATHKIDVFAKSIFFKKNIMKLQMWDTAGKDPYDNQIPDSLREFSAAIVVYDITNKDTFEATKKLVMDARNWQGKELRVILVGNKKDLEDKRKVSVEEGKTLAKDIDGLFFEISVKESIGIKDLFQKIILSIPGVKEAGLPETQDNLIEAVSTSDFNFSFLTLLKFFILIIRIVIQEIFPPLMQ